MLWDVEAPDYDQPRAFMSARQAMEVALALRDEGPRVLRAGHPPPRRPRGEEALPGAARRGGAPPVPRPRGHAEPARRPRSRTRATTRTSRSRSRRRPPQLSTTLHERAAQPADEGGARHRPGDVVALRLVAAEGGQQVERPLVLDPLGHHVQAEVVREVGGRAHDRGVLAALARPCP